MHWLIIAIIAIIASFVSMWQAWAWGWYLPVGIVVMAAVAWPTWWEKHDTLFMIAWILTGIALLVTIVGGLWATFLVWGVWAMIVLFVLIVVFVAGFVSSFF